MFLHFNSYFFCILKTFIFYNFTFFLKWNCIISDPTFRDLQCLLCILLSMNSSGWPSVKRKALIFWIRICYSFAQWCNFKVKYWKPKILGLKGYFKIVNLVWFYSFPWCLKGWALICSDLTPFPYLSLQWLGMGWPLTALNRVNPEMSWGKWLNNSTCCLGMIIESPIIFRRNLLCTVSGFFIFFFLLF